MVAELSHESSAQANLRIVTSIQVTWRSSSSELSHELPSSWFTCCTQVHTVTGVRIKAEWCCSRASSGHMRPRCKSTSRRRRIWSHSCGQPSHTRSTMR